MTKRILILIYLSLLLTDILAQQRIPMRLESTGIYTIPCEVNGLKLRFIFDTGAADVHLSLVEAAFMLKNGYLSSEDIIGKGNYFMADGSIAENSVVNLKEIRIGNVTINDVKACISSNIQASLLLGQSAIRKLGPYSINGDYLVLDNHSTNDLNGYKTITDNNGNVYTGFVSNGIYDGQGKMVYSNGEIYEGDWKLGKRNGKGILRYKNGGILYDGEWKEDKRHGYGKSYGIFGNRYEGYFLNGKYYGKGTYYNSNGDSTVANSTDYYSCTGTRYYKNGETITGEWIKGYKEGLFIHKYPNGKVVNEYYKNDFLMSTSIIQEKDDKSAYSSGTDTQKYDTAIKKWVQTENKKCPIDANNGQVITKSVYENKTLEFFITYNKYIFDYASIKLEKKTEFKELMLKMLLLNKTNKDVFNCLVNISGTLKYNYTSSVDRKKTFYIFTPSELKSAYAKYSNLTDETLYLNIQIESSNLVLPQKTEDGLLFNRIYFADSAVILEFIVDENTESFSYYLLQRNELKTQAKDAIKSLITTYGNFKKTFTICCQKSISIRYRYVGNLTNKMVDINIPPSELKEILNSVN